jgi:hypothetical protein
MEEDNLAYTVTVHDCSVEVIAFRHEEMGNVRDDDW